MRDMRQDIDDDTTDEATDEATDDTTGGADGAATSGANGANGAATGGATRRDRAQGDLRDGTGLPSETDVVVVGAGIAGLTAAVTAASAGAAVVVLEANDLGGRGRTAQRDGFALNIGPHALYDGGALREVLTAHGIDASGGRPGGRGVGMVRDGVRHEVTVSPLGLARSRVLAPRSRARVLALFARLPRMRAGEMTGRTVGEWLGDEPEDVQQFLGAFVRVSSYTHAPGEFDAGAAVEQLQLALRGVTYVDGGWTRIVGALASTARRHGAELRTHAPVDEIRSDGDAVLVSSNGHELRASTVVIASGGPDVAERLTGGRVRGRTALTAPIRAATLDLATRRPFPDSFSLGMDRPLYLSPHAPLARLAPEGRGLVTAMRYLAPDEDAGEPVLTRDELRHLARSAGIEAADVLWERALHQSVVSHGAPTAAGGGLAGRPRLDALDLPGVLLAGDWVGPQGMLADASAASGVAAGRAAARRSASIAA